ncbi:MAG: S8 family peptidase [Clostridium sp.]|nr:S8 family peptidase [Clostridium sp.]
MKITKYLHKVSSDVIKNSNNKNGYLINYTGEIDKIVSSIPNSLAIPLTPYVAAVFIDPNYESTFLALRNIELIEPFVEYILTEISPLDSSNIIQFNQGFPIDLTGTGVVVGLIDTGIDYTNKEFLREDDTSRILSIWDQSDSSGIAPSGLGYGSEYSNEQINQAIKESRNGKNPLDLVPEIDKIGHGTECAGIIGARGYGEVKGAAPNCDFVVVKLRVVDTISSSSNTAPTPVFSNVDIATAMYYLIQYRTLTRRPMVVFLPVSSNFGGHDGKRPIEELIDYYSFESNVVFAVGTGNQGNSQTHYSGKINSTSEISNINVQIGPNQNYLYVHIWSTYPDKISIGMISPSGQVIPKIPIKISQQETLTFIYEKTNIFIQYFLPISSSGSELILIYFEKPTPGIWKIILYGDYIINGKFNAWMSQRPISKDDTFFLNSDNFVTLTIPSTSYSAICTGFYNQNNNSLEASSGVGFTIDNRVKPNLTTGGVNMLTTAPNNKTTLITGSSVATAVLAGAIALILQWAIVNKNLPTISSEIVKAMLILGTKKRPKDIYPNPYAGHGLLDLLGTFNAIRGIYNTPTSSSLLRPNNNDNADP